MQSRETIKNKSGGQQERIRVPDLSLPKGGGAIRGIDEKLSINPSSGTASFNVQIPTTPGRSDFYPKLSLSYDSGAGNGPFGMSWSLSVPSITRRTDKGLPRYQDDGESDVFILSGAEDLIPSPAPEANQASAETLERQLDGQSYRVYRYRPRIEGLFARIERWVNQTIGDTHWRSVSKDNVTSIYGKTDHARIVDPEAPSKIFKWLLEESLDDKGNRVLYEYKQENADNLDGSLPQEKNRLQAFTNKYLKRIKYGNRGVANDWSFELIFDYGEHEPDAPATDEARKWRRRPDAFSSFRSGFEIRTYRLCRRVLMFHHFPELAESACLVRSMEFNYRESPVASFLDSITESGYIRQSASGNYQKQSLPPLEFTYTQPTIDEQIHFVDAESLENLPLGLDGRLYQWIDLDSEGVSGMLTEQARAWFYKRNLGNAKFAPAQLLASIPSLADLQSGKQQLLDLASDGQKSLVDFSQPLAGYYDRQEAAQWGSFTPFRSTPNLNWNDANLKFIDLDGDGRADVLISEDEVFVWYPSLGKQGFGPPETVRKLNDEERGAALVFADATQSVYLSDMSGDGLTDIVRIRNGEVCYWPNLGYGRFGAKVTMDDAPRFDRPEMFDQNCIRLADIDGSGTTDIIYLGASEITFWFNQSGNRWSEAQHLSSFPASDHLASVQVVDLLGNGTACLVWASPLPGLAAQRMQYIDLMGGQKPHLLKSVKNNLGSETRFAYASSTKFYLEDLAAGAPWITRLPFPVHVLERLETRDEASQTRLESLYRYHHGFYDGVEREFRGFGFVEQLDTQAFAQFKEPGLFSTAPAVIEEEFHLPPVLTKTWIHTGAFLTRENISRQYETEYYSFDQAATLLPDTILEPNLSMEEEREACRALKGSLLRQEIYALDGSPMQAHPYSVSERSYAVRRVQARGSLAHAVFYSHEREVIDYHYERRSSDPRTSHKLILHVDEFGNPDRVASIGYQRRANPSEPAHPKEQSETLITYTETDFIHKPDEPDFYRVSLPAGMRVYEITGLQPAQNRVFTFNEFEDSIQRAAVIGYEEKPAPGSLQKRLIEQTSSLYYKNDLSGPLPAGDVESLALPYESYKMALTPGLLNQLFEGRVSEDLLANEGRYVLQDGNWWVPSGRQILDARQFYLPVQVIDPFGKIFTTTYDRYALLVEQTADPLSNTITAKNNYRMMLPWHITDANDNRSAARFDALGVVVATVVMGKPGSTDGDHIDETTAEASAADDPTARIEYDLFNWINKARPYFVHTFTRERHGDPSTRWQESFTYFDGLGREVMKKIQAEPGLAPARGPDGKLRRDAQNKLIFLDTSPNLRWVGTGRTVYDNKGNAIKKYEPFFDSSNEYDDEKDLSEWGVTPIFRYDPLSRLIRTDHPNGTYSRVEFDAWQQTAFDENDTVLIRESDGSVIESRWYSERKGLSTSDPEGRAAFLTANGHAQTPAVAHLDTLGRTFLTISDNGAAGKYETRVEHDIEGNERAVIDAQRKRVMERGFDMLGRVLRTQSTEAGERRMLANVAGNPIRLWDSRNQTITTSYDELQRPTHLFVKQATSAEMLVERTVYGETHPGAVTLNLRGKVYQHYDGAGVATNQQHDFKGNLLVSNRQLAREYKTQVNWSALKGLNDVQAIADAAAPLLETEVFTSSMEYDALNRPLRIVMPDGSTAGATPLPLVLPASEIFPVYNEANLLERVEARLRGAASLTQFVTNIDYNAKGQRELIEYGNGVRTGYVYDPLTFRLTRLKTNRAAGDQRVLQDLRYTYDPVGNITEMRDDGQPTVFNDNAQVEPLWKYEYDALYWLIKAEGREHAGQNDYQPTSTRNDYRDYPFANRPNANDAQAMRNYTEVYEYDEVGNILRMIHQASDGNWSRRYAYERDAGGEMISNRLLQTSLPGDADDGPFSARYEYDPHGNMTRMPHLSSIAWNFKDELQQTDLGGGGTVYFTYDAAGQRTRKVWEKSAALIEERIYLGGYEIFRRRNGASVTLERQTLHIMDSQNRIALVETKTIDEGNLVEAPTPLIRFQVSNHLGSACLELDEAGAIISYEEYHPYGTTSFQSTRSGAEVSPKRYRYTGKERDEETGLSYHSSRYYAPWLTRWTACDPAGLKDGPNLYAYTKNNPLVLVDPNGTQGNRPDENQINSLFTVDEKGVRGIGSPFTQYGKDSLAQTIGLSKPELALADDLQLKLDLSSLNDVIQEQPVEYTPGILSLPEFEGTTEALSLARQYTWYDPRALGWNLAADFAAVGGGLSLGANSILAGIGWISEKVDPDGAISNTATMLSMQTPLPYDDAIAYGIQALQFGARAQLLRLSSALARQTIWRKIPLGTAGGDYVESTNALRRFRDFIYTETIKPNFPVFDFIKDAERVSLKKIDLLTKSAETEGGLFSRLSREIGDVAKRSTSVGRTLEFQYVGQFPTLEQRLAIQRAGALAGSLDLKLIVRPYLLGF